jgi:hypothetical protein
LDLAGKRILVADHSGMAGSAIVRRRPSAHTVPAVWFGERKKLRMLLYPVAAFRYSFEPTLEGVQVFQA